jgi:hypothetical protein
MFSTRGGKSWHAQRADWINPDQKETGKSPISGAAQSQPTVRYLLDLECEGSLEGFEFDDENCRRAFSHYDKDCTIVVASPMRTN